MTSFTTNTTTSSSAAAALLLLFISLSPVSAGAFSYPPSTSSQNHPSSRVLSTVTSSTARSGGGTFATTPSLFTSAAAASTTSSRMMKGVKLSSSPRSVISLSALSLLRGGDDVQIDVESSSSSSLDETESFDADINMQRVYGTNNNDEESPEAAVVEMTTKKSSTLKSKKSDLTYDASSTSTTSLMSSSRMALSSVVSPLSSILATFATFYTRQLSVRPILTKSLTAGIIFMASDYCAQLIDRSNNGTDEDDDNNNKMPLVWSRMVTNFLVGLLVFGPAANVWYSTIFKLLPSTSLVSTLQKAALGQLIFGPAFTSVFFGAGMIQAGSFSVGGWLQKVQQDLPAVWASGLGFWPVVDFISYKIIPVQWIPLFVNFCSFVWTMYLSIVSNRGSSGEDTA